MQLSNFEGMLEIIARPVKSTVLLMEAAVL